MSKVLGDKIKAILEDYSLVTHCGTHPTIQSTKQGQASQELIELIEAKNERDTLKKEKLEANIKLVSTDATLKVWDKQLKESQARVKELEEQVEQEQMANGWIIRSAEKYPECRYIIMDIEEWSAKFKSKTEFEDIKQYSFLGKAFQYALDCGMYCFDLWCCDDDKQEIHMDVEGGSVNLPEWYQQQLEKENKK